jgi:hypothetical protein
VLVGNVFGCITVAPVMLVVESKESRWVLSIFFAWSRNRRIIKSHSLGSMSSRALVMGTVGFMMTGGAS